MAKIQFLFFNCLNLIVMETSVGRATLSTELWKRGRPNLMHGSKIQIEQIDIEPILNSVKYTTFSSFNEASKPGDNIDWRVTIRVKDAEKGEKVEESFCTTNVWRMCHHTHKALKFVTVVFILVAQLTLERHRKEKENWPQATSNARGMKGASAKNWLCNRCVPWRKHSLFVVFLIFNVCGGLWEHVSLHSHFSKLTR